MGRGAVHGAHRVIYFWADTHFNHRGIMEYCSRGWAQGDVHRMNEILIARWNHRVGKKDEVYFLGDFGFSHSKLWPLEAVFDQLNGHKHLVIGNHDEKNPEAMKLPWSSKRHIAVVRHEGKRVVCCHYPLESWPGAHKGRLHAHGHSHGTLKRVVPHRFDVGADVEPWPVSIDELFARAEKQVFESSDHHEL